MATIGKRGSTWRAIVRRKGEPSRSATFPTKGMAEEWVKRIEREIHQRRASGSSTADALTLAELINWYVDDAVAEFGRSKSADLKRIATYEIAGRVAITLRRQDYVQHVRDRRKAGAGPATVINDLVWIRGVLKAARASRGLNISLDELEAATEHLRATNVISKSRKRQRRLQAGEEAKILTYLEERASSIPMADIVRFALASTRRQEEITRIRRVDLDRDKGICWLDDVKHPRLKVGNRRAFRILPEAIAIADRQTDNGSDLLFPYNSKTIGALFSRATTMLGIEDLTFHDLRHEATSRLFERGYAIHEVAQFTLHDSWATLRIYANLRPEDVRELPSSDKQKPGPVAGPGRDT